MARLLVIEDNPANLELMTYLLHAFGHTTISAGDGEEGLALAEREPVDLIVCDVHLPKLDGYQIAQRLKADPQLRGVPLVAVTALAMVGDRDKVLAAGFDGYIAKPIDPQEFVRQIDAFLPAGARRPGSNATPTATAAAEPLAAAPNAGARILVVDDFPANRDLACATLVPNGYRVTVAESVRRALELLAEERFDLIVSDLHMPDQDGFSFLATVKADARLKTIPFLLITSANCGARDRLRGQELGAKPWLLRPMEPQQLLREVATCLATAKES